MMKLAAAALLVFGASPAFAVPPNNPADAYPAGTTFSDPPIWVSAHGVEKWIFNGWQCFSTPQGTMCADGPPVTPGTPAPFRGTTLRVRRGELVTFHMGFPVAEFGIRLNRRKLQLLRPGLTVRWRVPASGIASVHIRHVAHPWDSSYSIRFLAR